MIRPTRRTSTKLTRRTPVPRRPRPGHRARIRAGFSLIELLTVFIIAGILGMMSIGRISSMISQSKVTRASQAVTNDLQSAFAIAARNRQPVRIVWDASRMSFSITNRAQTMTYRKVTLGAFSGYNFTASNVTMYPTVPVEVYPNGLATDSIAFSITFNGYRKRIGMTRAGLVRSY
jgi:type II secretory pathway pseudopilin PulG